MRLLVPLLLLCLCFGPMPASAQDQDTMLSPRGKESYEKHLAELNAKYGADPQQSALKSEVLQANAAPAQRQSGVARVALPADLVPGQRLRVELLPHANSQFRFQDEVFDTASLIGALGQLQRGYVIDQVVLLSDEDHAILVDHLLELARIARTLQVTTAYQQGRELKLISAQ